MRFLVLLLAVSVCRAAPAEIRDILKSAEIEERLARAAGDSVLHERPHYSVRALVRSGPAAPAETHPDSDEILFVRQGRAVITLTPPAGQAARLTVAAGDVVKIPARASHRIEPQEARFGALALRVAAISASVPTRQGIRPAERRMPDLLKKAEIDATFAKFDSNQPIHSAPNFTMNYVIYPGRGGPWEAHAGCVDVYFVQTGTATAQIGGEIRNAKEDVPGEPRGDGVTGARTHTIGSGDLVLIPRDTAHHMEPGAGKLGYILVKVWVD